MKTRLTPAQVKAGQLVGASTPQDLMKAVSRSPARETNIQPKKRKGKPTR